MTVGLSRMTKLKHSCSMIPSGFQYPISSLSSSSLSSFSASKSHSSSSPKFSSSSSSFSQKCLWLLFLTTMMFATCAVVMVDGIPRVGAGGSSKFQTSKYYLSNKCSSADVEAIHRCETDSMDDWDVRDVDFNTPTRRFCCYTWNSLDCEVRIAQRCDPDYAARLAVTVEQTYGSVCEYYSRRSASCALRWWSIMLIVLGGLLIITVIVFVFYRRRQSKFTSEYNAVNSNNEFMRQSHPEPAKRNPKSNEVHEL